MSFLEAALGNKKQRKNSPARKKLELVTLEEYNNYYQKVSKEKMNQQGTAILPNWDNHNKDVCEIQSYYLDREHTELLLLKQEYRIENTCVRKM